MREFSPSSTEQWRHWLEANHGTQDGVWLVFSKKHTGEPVLDYEMAVEEALCFGWIDGLIKKLDEEHYARKFTPRRPGSKWSELNKRRVERLIKNGRMRSEGQVVIDAARADGSWEKQDRPPVLKGMPREFEQALNQHPRARTFFETLAPSYQKRYLLWIDTAKRPETRKRRIEEALHLLEAGEKLGLK